MVQKLEFSIQAKSGVGETAATSIIAYHKTFGGGYRFTYATGIKVKRPRNGVSVKPNEALKRLLEIADKAYHSLIAEGKPVNTISLRTRIDLIRSGFKLDNNDLSIWDNNRITFYAIPDGTDTKKLIKSLQEEQQRPKPNFKRVVDTVTSNSDNSLFGFWKSVLDGKVKARAGKSLRKSTVIAKRQTLKIVQEFKSNASFETMDRRFYNDFTSWMKEREKPLDDNTIGRHIKELKSILHLASANELMTDQRFTYWPVIKFKNEVVALSKEELLRINALELTGTNENVRDIFIIACFLGVRIGDITAFKKESLSTSAGITYFEYVAGKTSSRVKIPVHPVVLKILAKRGGEFPRMISEQNFRYALKEICQLEKAELTERVVIKIRDGKPEYAKKWEAISPHSSRRTFASSLFYGWFGKPMPASLCMRYTGHKSEASFFLYIGANAKDLDAKGLQYFDVEPQMKVS